MYGLAYPVIDPYMGILVGWKAFIAAVVGGIGNIRGAMIGAFILGAVEIMVVALLPSTYRDLVASSLLLLILLVRPTAFSVSPGPEGLTAWRLAIGCNVDRPRWLLPVLLVGGLLLTLAADTGLWSTTTSASADHRAINVILAASLNLVNGYMGEFWWRTPASWRSAPTPRRC